MVFIDYLNICASTIQRLVATQTLVYISPSQKNSRTCSGVGCADLYSHATNRTGFASNDFGLEDTSESFGLPATADLMFGLIATEELDEQREIMVKQLKNRYNDVATNKKFVVGINRGKMKLHDVSNADKTFVGAGQDPDDLVDSAGVGFNGQNFDEKFKSSKSKFNN